MRILATFVRKKHSLRWRQPKLSSSFVHDVSKRFAEAALRHPCHYSLQKGMLALTQLVQNI